MLPIAKAFVVLALAYSASASECSGSCVESDETSLVQLQSVVNHRSENGEGPATQAAPPPAKPKAKAKKAKAKKAKKAKKTKAAKIVKKASSDLDAGDVKKAFMKNYLKERDSVEGDAADDISFKDGVHKVRHIEKEMADDRVRAAKRDLHDTLLKDADKVHDAKMKRHTVLEDTENEVKVAKENYLAHRLKQRQVEYAARLGREMGHIEGVTEKRRALADWKAEQAREDQEDLDAQAKADLLQKKKDQRDAMNKQLERMAEVDEDRATSTEQRVAEAKAKDELRTKMLEDSITGPGGLGDLVDNIKADWAKQRYQYHADQLDEMN